MRHRIHSPRSLLAFAFAACCLFTAGLPGCGSSPPAERTGPPSGGDATPSASAPSAPIDASEFFLGDDETQIDLRQFAPKEAQEYEVAVGTGPVLPFLGVRMRLSEEERAELIRQGTDGVPKPAIRIEQTDPVDGTEVRVEMAGDASIRPRTINGQAKIRVTNLLDKPLQAQVYKTADTLTEQYGHEKTGAFNPATFQEKTSKEPK